MFLKRYLIKLNFLFRQVIGKIEEDFDFFFTHRCLFSLLQSLKNKRRATGLLFWIFCCVVVALYVLIQFNNDPLAIETPFIYIEPINSYFRFRHSLLKKDWHDRDMIKREAQRRGPGEQGTGVALLKGLKILS
jgi:lipid-A-disaccharide synthase-like uncharacterized protein